MGVTLTLNHTVFCFLNWLQGVRFFKKIHKGLQDSSQGILACRAGTRAPPAGTHETKKNKFFHVLCMYLSSKHAEMHRNTPLLPFY
jgi:hypothetical protein